MSTTFLSLGHFSVTTSFLTARDSTDPSLEQLVEGKAGIL